MAQTLTKTLHIHSNDTYQLQNFTAELTQTKNIETNTSTISWKLTANNVTTSSSSKYAIKDFALIINGTSVYSHPSPYLPGDWVTAGFPWASGDRSGVITVPHLEDGSKTITVTLTGYTYDGGTKTDTASWELVTIERYPILTYAQLYAKNVSSAPVTITNKIPHAMDKIYYSLKPKDESEESDITEIDINAQTTILTLTTGQNYYVWARSAVTQLIGDDIVVNVPSWSPSDIVISPVATIGSDFTLSILDTSEITNVSVTLKENNTNQTVWSYNGQPLSMITANIGLDKLDIMVANITNTYLIPCTLTTVYTTTHESGITTTDNNVIILTDVQSMKPELPTGGISAIATDNTTLQFIPSGDGCISTVSTMLFSWGRALTKHSNSVVPCTYVINIDGITTLIDDTTTTITFESENHKPDSIILTVIDGRGLMTVYNYTIANFYDYSIPVIFYWDTVVNRINEYEEIGVGTTLDINVKGSLSHFNNFTNKNNIVTYQIFYKENGGEEHSEEPVTAFQPIYDGDNFSFHATSLETTFDEGRTYEVAISVGDTMGNIVKSPYFYVMPDEPLVWFDRSKKSIGFGSKPIIEPESESDNGAIEVWWKQLVVYGTTWLFGNETRINGNLFVQGENLINKIDEFAIFYDDEGATSDITLYEPFTDYNAIAIDIGHNKRQIIYYTSSIEQRLITLRDINAYAFQNSIEINSTDINLHDNQYIDIEDSFNATISSSGVTTSTTNKIKIYAVYGLRKVDEVPEDINNE